MESIKFSDSVEERINKVSTEYKNKIINKLALRANTYEQEITECDVDKAVNEIFRYEYESSLKIRNLIKKQRRYMLFSLIMILQILLTLSFLILNKSIHFSELKIDHYMIVISAIIALLSLCFSLYVRNIRKKIPDKRSLTSVFMDKWTLFETLLKIMYEQKEKRKNSSFLDLIHILLNTFDDNYMDKPSDFKYVLDIRNRIVHNDGFEEISTDEIQRATEILDKLTHSVKNDLRAETNNGKTK